MKLYRTKFPPSTLRSNISYNLNFLVSHYILSIDRVLFSINYKYFNQVHSELKLCFDTEGSHTRTKYGKQTWRYISGQSLIQLIRYPTSYCFQVQVHDLSHSVWNEVLKALFSVIPLHDRINALSLSQCEIAMDFYAVEGVSIEEIGRKLVSSITMKHARVDFFNTRDTTAYFGHKGNARTGTKGLRCYPKLENGCFRIELQANRKILREFELSSNFYPLDIDPRQYIEFRSPLNESGYQKLCRAVCKKKGVDLKNITPMHTLVMRKIHLREFLCLHCDRYGDCLYAEIEPTSKPVQCQIDAFKTVKKRFELTHGIDHFFPKVKNTNGSLS